MDIGDGALLNYKKWSNVSWVGKIAATVFFGASEADGGVSNMQKGTEAAQGFRTWWVVVHGNSRQILAYGTAQAQSVCR